MTHICVGKLTIIGSDNGLSPGRRQAIIWTSAGILLIGPLGTNFNDMLFGIQIFSFKKMHLKMSSAKWRPFCSASMCWYMVLRYRQRDMRNLIRSLKINEKPVERVTEFNFLGLTIDETLSWHPHVQKISNDISRTLGIMGRLKKFLPINILILMYNSLVLPHL